MSDDSAIYVVNPSSGAWVRIERERITQEWLDACAAAMDDEIRKELHSRLAPCSPADFVAAYVDKVGPDVAGVVLLS